MGHGQGQGFIVVIVHEHGKNNWPLPCNCRTVETMLNEKKENQQQKALPPPPPPKKPKTNKLNTNKLKIK